MTQSLSPIIELHLKAIDIAAHVLRKGCEHAAALGVTEGEMLDWRLIDDMQPVRFQLTTVVNFTRSWPARAAGLPSPGEIGSDLSATQFAEELANSRAWLSGLDCALLDSRADEPLNVTLGNGMSPTLPAGRWLTGFATQNILFHAHMVYAILRARGVKVGKVDLFPTGL